jgi:YVTN family beta-propeller protein
MRLILAAATIVLVSIQGASSQAPLVPVGSIELPGVEGRIDHLAVDTAAQRLYVAALGNNTVEVLDLKDNKHLKSVPGFREPQGIAVLPEAKLVAIANGQGEGVSFSTPVITIRRRPFVSETILTTSGTMPAPHASSLDLATVRWRRSIPPMER